MKKVYLVPETTVTVPIISFDSNICASTGNLDPLEESHDLEGLDWN